MLSPPHLQSPVFWVVASIQGAETRQTSEIPATPEGGLRVVGAAFRMLERPVCPGGRDSSVGGDRRAGRPRRGQLANPALPYVCLSLFPASVLPPCRAVCTSSSSLTPTPPVECACSLWPSSSASASAGCTVSGGRACHPPAPGTWVGWASLWPVSISISLFLSGMSWVLPPVGRPSCFYTLLQHREGFQAQAL